MKDFRSTIANSCDQIERQTSSLRKRHFLLFACSLFSSVGCNKTTPPPETGVKPANQSTPIAVDVPPNERLMLTLNTENQTALSDFRGKVVFVAFWSTWCPMCGEELKALQLLKNSFKGREFEVVGVLVDDSPDSAKEFIRKSHISFPIIVDKDRLLATWADALSIPTLIALGKNGEPVDFIDPDTNLPTKTIQGFRSWGSALGKNSVEKLLQAR